MLLLAFILFYFRPISDVRTALHHTKGVVFPQVVQKQQTRLGEVRNIIFDRFRPLPKIIKIGRVWNESVPIQLTQCRFPGLAISHAKILIYFFKSNIRKQFYQTTLGNCYGLKLPKNADCSLRKQIDCVVYYNFRHTFVP